MLAGTGGASSALILRKVKGEYYWSITTTINGCLTGMVSCCAGCNVFQPWTAFLTGFIGGLTFTFTDFWVLKAKIDDPIGAVAVHFGGGFWGALAQPLWKPGGVFLSAFQNLAAWKSLGWQLLGVCAISAWSITLTVITCLLLNKADLFRVRKDWEKRGQDVPKHGEPAYPDTAYEQGWKCFYSHDLKGVPPIKIKMKPLDCATHFKEADVSQASDAAMAMTDQKLMNSSRNQIAPSGTPTKP